jgi:hypothetical protein
MNQGKDLRMKAPCIILGSLLVAAFSAVSLLDQAEYENKMVSDVKLGNAKLVCEIRNKGVIEIAPNKVVGFDDGVWIFTNGSARECTFVN